MNVVPRFNTPLRYPGGKQKLTQFVIEVLEANSLEGGDYVEPYAGGAGVGIELLLRGAVSHIHLNDTCKGIYSFWKSVVSETEALCKLITDAKMNVKEWRRQQEILSRPSEFDRLQVGFSLFYLNRCNRSGIIKGGLIGGLNQDGPYKMDVRFPKAELVKRIMAIAALKDHVSVRNWDAESFLRSYVSKLPDKSLVYLDPPYFHRAKRLYQNSYLPKDHQRLALTIQTALKKPWIVSYDCAPEVIREYAARKSFVYDLQYHAGLPEKGKEVFFFADSVKIPTVSKISAINTVLQLINKP